MSKYFYPGPPIHNVLMARFHLYTLMPFLDSFGDELKEEVKKIEMHLNEAIDKLEKENKNKEEREKGFHWSDVAFDNEERPHGGHFIPWDFSENLNKEGDKE